MPKFVFQQPDITPINIKKAKEDTSDPRLGIVRLYINWKIFNELSELIRNGLYGFGSSPMMSDTNHMG